ncbi:unnamed protein product, partial [Caenorhabditis auriculariae]
WSKRPKDKTLKLYDINQKLKKTIYEHAVIVDLLLLNPRMEKLANFYRWTDWKIRKLLKNTNRTISPILWTAPRLKEKSLPSASFKSELPVELRPKLDFIVKETLLFSRLSPMFPSKLDDKAWKSLLECQNRKQRLDQIIFLKNVEKIREREALKKVEAREAKKETKTANGDGLCLIDISNKLGEII